MPAKGASCSEIDPPRKSAGLCVRCPARRGGGARVPPGSNGRVVFIRTALPFRIRPFRRIGTSSVRGDQTRRGCLVRPSRVGGRRSGHAGRSLEKQLRPVCAGLGEPFVGPGPDVPCPGAAFLSVRAESFRRFRSAYGGAKADRSSCGTGFCRAGTSGRESLPIKCG